jgi:hypothetical protein
MKKWSGCLFQRSVTSIGGYLPISLCTHSGHGFPVF